VMAEEGISCPYRSFKAVTTNGFIPPAILILSIF
jgi:hypothetical protein